MLKRLPFIFFILSFFFIFLGCTINKASLTHISKNDYSSPQVVLNELGRDDHFRNTLKATAYIEATTSQGSYPVKVAMMSRRPSSLRLETIPFFGPPDMILSVYEGVLKVFLTQKGAFYIGEASTKNLGYFSPFSTIGLQVEDVISILFGTHPKIKGKAITLSGSHEGNLYRLDILSENRRVQSLWVDKENDYLVGVDLFTDDKSIMYSVRFTGHSSTKEVAMPDKITIAYGDNGKPHVTIRYSDIQMATDIDMAIFDLQRPPGIKTIYID